NNNIFDRYETYKLLSFKEDSWRNYNQLYPFPKRHIILILYSLAREYKLSSINVHYAVCLLQRYIGLKDINKKIVATQAQDEFMEVISNYLRIPLVDEVVALLLQSYFPGDERLNNICQQVLDFIYLQPRNFLEHSFTLIALGVISVAYAIMLRTTTVKLIRWGMYIMSSYRMSS
ncbi:hypothetical protein SAMD00019534_099590, partial [Acytostelium subglobosum LB1]|uniref:hypothetical protein n=1 Tax=Acytostelium subglobosum LB1 TaxID=1410327 RepID=UPI000645145C